MKVYEHRDDENEAVSLRVEVEPDAQSVRFICDAPGERAVGHTITSMSFDDLVLEVYRGLGRVATPWKPGDPLPTGTPPNAGDAETPE